MTLPTPSSGQANMHRRLGVAATPSLDDILTLPNLKDAWLDVKANRAGAGPDNISLKRYERTLETRLLNLADRVRNQTYRPGPVRRAHVTMRGKQRTLTILTVDDRVLQRALLNALQFPSEILFLDCSFGYRPGRSVNDALEAVIAARNRGLSWVADADISACFDEIDHGLLADIIDQVFPSLDFHLRALLHLVIQRPGRHNSDAPPKGIPLGAPLSPLFCNLYLHALDHAISQNHELIRYADDFLVLCQSLDDLILAHQRLLNVTAALKLRLNAHKTRLVSFDDGFIFLGAAFEGDKVTLTFEDKRIVCTSPPLPPVPNDYGW